MPRKSTDRQRPVGPSQRQLRVGEELRHALVEVLTRANFRDPDLQAVSITVSQVQASPDLKHATAFVVPLAGREMDAVVKALNRASAYLRGEVGRLIRLRHVPELVFAADRSFEHASRIDAALRQPAVQRDLSKPESPDRDGEEEG